MTSDHQTASFAKINLFLHVGNRRADGFHEIETLFQTIDLADTVRFTIADRFSLTCSDPTIPTDATNLIARACELLKREASFPPLSIHLEKKIPAGGGLGGGSSNAATTLTTIVKMFDLPVSTSRLLELATELGSDVPFFILGGSVYATGRGEKLISIDEPPRLPLLLILPPEKVPTPEAYRRLVELRAEASFPHGPSIGIERARTALKHPSDHLVALFRNDLEDPVFKMHPALAGWKRELYDAGAIVALMSGSGSTLFGLFDRVEHRDEALELLTPRVSCVAASMLTPAR